MRLPLFREAIINNIHKTSKKTASVSVRLYKESDELIYVSKEKTRRAVIGYTNPKTGLFIVDTKDVETNQNHEPYKMFRDAATEYAQETITNTLQDLKELFEADSESYSSKYKELSQIERELNAFITDKQDFYIDIQKQVDILVSKPLPHINEWLVYQDDVNTDKIVTAVVPYNNPSKQTLTAEQKTIVDRFLDVFVDKYNKNVLSWYFGAILLNLSMQDDRISKALIVSSSNGGSGKSTLINSLANGVVTHPYRVIDSGFDKHFRANDKFSTSDLPTCRLGIYSEAYFNSETGDSLPHNFDGLDESELKSWITDGYVANEKKYADKQIAKLTGMQIILTNHPPKIPDEREDLSRRFLALIVKPSNMIKDKAKELSLKSEKELYKYVSDNAQAFANYFVSTFKRNPNQYQLSKYNTAETESEINHSQSEYLSNKQVSHNELIIQDSLVVITKLCQDNNIDPEPFINLLIAEQQQSTRKDIRWDDDYLYLSSSKSFYIENNIFGLRDALKDLLGSPIKKFSQRMFGLKRKL